MTEEEVITTCFICGKNVSDINSFECSNCHARYCFWAHKKELNYQGFFGSAYSESKCLKCGQLIFDTTSEEGNQETQEKTTKPTGYYIPTDKTPKECPACGGENISAVLKPQIGKTERILDVIFGILVIAGIYYTFAISGVTDDYNETVALIILAFGLWLGASYIWLGLTLRPLGRYIIAPKFKKHTFCEDCQHHWILDVK